MNNPQIAMPLVVAYTLRPTGLMEVCPPEISFPSNWKPETCEEKRAEKLAEFAAKQMPYYFTFSHVRITDSLAKEVLDFEELPAPAAGEGEKKTKKSKAAPSEPLIPRGPLIQRLFEWLVDDSKYAFLWCGNPKRLAEERGAKQTARQQAVGERYFVGFGIRRFVKIMGLECALHGLPLPLGAWFANSNHKDLEHALLPPPFSVGYKAALTRWGLQEYLPFTPHLSIDDDMRLSMELMTRLGFTEETRALLAHSAAGSEAVES